MNSETRALLKFYICGICIALETAVVATVSIILGTIPSFFGYGGHVNHFAFNFYYKFLSFFTGVEAQFDEESLALFKNIKKPVIFVTNHQSSFDIPLFGRLMDTNTVIISKKQVKYVPFVGLYMLITGAIFLDRDKKKKNKSYVDQVVNIIQKNNVSVWIFPEGTRSHLKVPGLLPFKTGAFHMAARAKIPIVPIVFGNYHHIFDEENRMLRSGKIPCKVLPPISTDNIGNDAQSIEILANECHNKMLEFLLDSYEKKKKD